MSAGRGLAATAVAVSMLGVWSSPSVERVEAGGRYLDGPPPGYTAGFGEASCHECHFEQEFNDAVGALQVAGVPDPYVLGQAYRLTVRLTHPEMQRGGFQLSARAANGNPRGRHVGTLRPTDDRVGLSGDGGGAGVYAHHTEAGTSLTSAQEATWTVDWTAPSLPIPIVFHVAANAANDDASEFGDHIYTTERMVRPSP